MTSRNKDICLPHHNTMITTNKINKILYHLIKSPYSDFSIVSNVCKNLPNIKCPRLSILSDSITMLHIYPHHVYKMKHTQEHSLQHCLRTEDKKRPKCPLIWDWVKQTETKLWNKYQKLTLKPNYRISIKQLFRISIFRTEVFWYVLIKISSI